MKHAVHVLHRVDHPPRLLHHRPPIFSTLPSTVILGCSIIKDIKHNPVPEPSNTLVSNDWAGMAQEVGDPVSPVEGSGVAAQLQALMNQFEERFTTLSDLIIDVRSGQTTLENRVNVMDGTRESGGVRRRRVIESDEEGAVARQDRQADRSATRRVPRGQRRNQEGELGASA